MKLNPDCIRDCLLALESLPYGERCRINVLMNMPELTGYSEVDIQYTCLKLMEAQYIRGVKTQSLRSPEQVVEIYDITFQGHEFLNSIRSDTAWSKAKNTAKAAGIFSLQGLSEIASQVAAAAIAQALKLNL